MLPIEVRKGAFELQETLQISTFRYLHIISRRNQVRTDYGTVEP